MLGIGGIGAAVGQFLKVTMFFLSLWKERDIKKAAEKKEVAKEMANAMAETDRKLQASRVNAAINHANRLR